MQKLFLTLFLVPIGFSLLPIFTFGFYGDSSKTRIMIATFFILIFLGLCLYVKLWVNQFKPSKSSNTGLWILMILCFSAFYGYSYIRSSLYENNKQKFLQENCVDIKTKTNGYTLKKCDDGSIHGDGYILSEYISEGGEYKTPDVYFDRGEK